MSVYGERHRRRVNAVYAAAATANNSLQHHIAMTVDPCICWMRPTHRGTVFAATVRPTSDVRIDSLLLKADGFLRVHG